MLLYFVLGLTLVGLLVYMLNLKSRQKPNLSDVKVLITGGSSGIGYCLAEIFHSHGSHVTLAARDMSKLKDAQSRLETSARTSSGKVGIISLDLSSSFESIETVLKSYLEQHGTPDILINCAGYAVSRKFTDTEPQIFENLIRTNYLSAVYTTKICLPHMLVDGKSCSTKVGQRRIVFVSSMAGQVGIYGFSGYSASKYALRGFAEALDMELEGKGPRVTIAFPPDTDTPGLAAENIGKPEATKEMCSAGGLASPECVAQTIFYDIVDGKLISSFGLEGTALAWATSGISLPVSYKRNGQFPYVTLIIGTIVEILTAAPLRAFGIGYALWLRYVARKY